MKIVEIFPRLLTDCKPVECPPDANGPTIFESMEYGDMCSDADLRTCILYIRGSYRLQIPSRWRQLLPTHIWEAFYGNPDGPNQQIYTYLDNIYLIKKNSQILPYMGIYHRIWIYGKNRTRTEPIIYWLFIGKKPYRNVEKKPYMGCFPGVLTRCLLQWA